MGNNKDMPRKKKEERKRLKEGEEHRDTKNRVEKYHPKVEIKKMYSPVNLANALTTILC